VRLQGLSPAVFDAGGSTGTVEENGLPGFDDYTLPDVGVG